jgi:hypothetical protein
VVSRRCMTGEVRSTPKIRWVITHQLGSDVALGLSGGSRPSLAGGLPELALPLADEAEGCQP